MSSPPLLSRTTGGEAALKGGGDDDDDDGRPRRRHRPVRHDHGRRRVQSKPRRPPRGGRGGDEREIAVVVVFVFASSTIPSAEATSASPRHSGSGPHFSARGMVQLPPMPPLSKEGGGDGGVGEGGDALASARGVAPTASSAPTRRGAEAPVVRGQHPESAPTPRDRRRRRADNNDATILPPPA